MLEFFSSCMCPLNHSTHTVELPIATTQTTPARENVSTCFIEWMSYNLLKCSKTKVINLINIHDDTLLYYV